MIELTIIKSLGICALILANIMLAIITTLMIEEYIYWKGKEEDE